MGIGLNHIAGINARNFYSSVLKKLNLNQEKMTKKEWIDQFNRDKHKFRWFINEYFPGVFEVMEIMVNEREYQWVLGRMQDIWFTLPNNKFNIKENPKGWKEFLKLLETEITD